MERNIAWSNVLPGHGADTALTLTRAEAWLSLALMACATLVTVATFGGAVWLAATV